ncbi:MAG: hypothetical protein KJ755_13275 [Alphaproteobacteria bacterium]|nr:hypothetical protein [Alphaproteobacteria bacterium]
MLKPATDIRPYLGVGLVSVIAWLAFTLPDHPDAIGWNAFLRLADARAPDAAPGRL